MKHESCCSLYKLQRLSKERSLEATLYFRTCLFFRITLLHSMNCFYRNKNGTSVMA